MRLQIIRRSAGALALAGLLAPAPSVAYAQDLLTISVDHARIVTMDEAVETVIVGNPMIVDVAIHDSRTLILTGRSYGTTNLVALDREGRAVIDEEVAVTGVETAALRVYRQAQRYTYTCAPACEPTITVGDTPGAFEVPAMQFETRERLARGAASTPIGE